MEHDVYKRRIVFGGAASVAALAASILAGGTAFAVSVPGATSTVGRVPAVASLPLNPHGVDEGTTSALPRGGAKGKASSASRLPLLGGTASGVPVAAEAAGVLQRMNGVRRVLPVSTTPQGLPDLGAASRKAVGVDVASFGPVGGAARAISDPGGTLDGLRSSLPGTSGSQPGDDLSNPAALIGGLTGAQGDIPAAGNLTGAFSGAGPLRGLTQDLGQ